MAVPHPDVGILPQNCADQSFLGILPGRRTSPNSVTTESLQIVYSLPTLLIKATERSH